MPVYTCITAAKTLAQDTKAALAAEITTMLINGVIRAGRADADKVRLAKDISSSSSRIAGIPEARILVSLQEFQARFAVEYGRALPEPDAEDDWLAESNDLIR
jgi:phenylpyruvate tautomerase PptA (4-oxalocrotonate tautomerase family)